MQNKQKPCIQSAQNETSLALDFELIAKQDWIVPKAYDEHVENPF